MANRVMDMAQAVKPLILAGVATVLLAGAGTAAATGTTGLYLGGGVGQTEGEGSQRGNEQREDDQRYGIAAGIGQLKGCGGIGEVERVNESGNHLAVVPYLTGDEPHVSARRLVSESRIADYVEGLLLQNCLLL